MPTSNSDVEAMLDSIDLGHSWRKLASQTTDKDYRRIVAFDNCTSYSQLGELHACPRSFQLMKYEAKISGPSETQLQNNLDFAFGHSVGAGVQTLIATGSLEKALFAAFVSWKAEYFADADDIARSFGNTKTNKCKSLAYAQFAVEKFHAQQLVSEWEIYKLPNGKPGVEISFSLDLENGFKHYGHIDLILRNKNTGAIAIWELKTTGFTSVDEALYANSSQALSYGVILDSIEPDLAEYDVNYAVYSSPAMEWQVIPFRKSLTQKAEAIADILLDQANIGTYRKMNYFPKRGESCIRFGRRCKYFGSCDLTSQVTYQNLPQELEAEPVDFSLTKSQIIATQRNKVS